MAAAVRSTLDELAALAEELTAALGMVLDHSEAAEHDTTPDSGAVLVLHTTAGYWKPFPREHQGLIRDAGQLLERWEGLTDAAIRSAAPNRLEKFRKHSEVMRNVVEQSTGAGAKGSSTDRIRQKVAESVEKQLDMLRDLPSAHGSGELLVVPDTNSVIFQPALEDWKPPAPAGVIVAVPQLIRELDELKVSDRAVAEVAGSAIRRFNEYARRGDTFRGVKLRDGLQFREVAVEADMNEAPKWLRAGHADDQLLASTLELRWQDLTSPVLLVTRDRNLMNKARLSRVACVYVEDIAEPRQKQPAKPKPTDATAEATARERLKGALPWAKAKLGVPPESNATNPNQQSWTVQATPLSFDAGDFRKRVLGAPASEWFIARAREAFYGPPGVPQSEPYETTGQAGIAVRRDFVLPVKGSVLLVADAGGIVGGRYYLEPNPGGRRAFPLDYVEREHFRPLIQTCADALTELGTSGDTLIELYAAGVSSSEVLTSGHATLSDQRDGWLEQGLVHIGGRAVKQNRPTFPGLPLAEASALYAALNNAWPSYPTLLDFSRSAAFALADKPKGTSLEKVRDEAARLLEAEGLKPPPKKTSWGGKGKRLTYLYPTKGVPTAPPRHRTTKLRGLPDPVGEELKREFAVLSLRLWLGQLSGRAKRTRAAYVAWQPGTGLMGPTTLDRVWKFAPCKAEPEAQNAADLQAHGTPVPDAVRTRAEEVKALINSRKGRPVEVFDFGKAVRAVLAGPHAEAVAAKQ